MTSDPTERARRIVVLDGDPAGRLLVEQLLRGDGYADVAATGDPDEALARCAGADLLVADLRSPAPGALALLERVGAGPSAIVLAEDPAPDERLRALELGAVDVVARPLDVAELLLRVRNLLRARRWRHEHAALEDRVRARTAELESARADVLERLAQAAEYRDDEGREHAAAVGRLSARIAAALGLGDRYAEMIARAAPLHDVGKLAIPDAILLKAGPLTAEEMAVVRDHPRAGAALLAGSASPLMRLAEEIAGAHHERWDGGGYPAGLAGEAIPLSARIVAVADVFDTLTRPRPYREPWSAAAALDEVRRGAGTLFDPRVVEALPAVSA